MPLVAGLRRVFDLDAEPAVIDAHLGTNGLAELVAKHPGVRVPGVLERLEGASPDEFSAADRTLQRAAGVTTEKALLSLAARWRPWRAYAAQLLTLGRM
jgi:AraC family transcriptional regulator of adaptative response / DNA-3-methyladenine glycosylase II